MNPRVLASGLSVALLAACTSFGTTPEPAMDDAGLVDGSLPSVGADGAALDGASPDDPDATTGRDGGRDGGEPRGWGAIFVSKAVTKGALGDSQGVADSLCGAEGQAVKPGATFVALLSVAAGDGLSARLRGSRGPRHVLGPGGARGARAIADVGAAGAVLGPVKTHADGSAVVQGTLVWTGGFEPAPTVATKRCVGNGGTAWSEDTAFFAGTLGDPSQSGFAAGNVADATCDQPNRLYCVELGDFL